MFTISNLFQKLALDEPELTIHKQRVGISVRDSYKTVNGHSPEKVEENGLLVFQYPDSFKERASKVYRRYLRNNKLQGFLSKPKRKRIKTAIKIEHYI